MRAPPSRRDAGIVAVLLVVASCASDANPEAEDAGSRPDAMAYPRSCDTVHQDCATGLRCVARDTELGRLASCEPATGNVGLGERCVTTTPWVDDCAPGLMCLKDIVSSVPGQGTCRRQCVAGSCGAGESCLQYITLVDGLCAAPCAPLDPAACATGMTCDYAYALTGDGTHCRVAGTKQEGEPCSGGQNNNCAANLTCIGEGSRPWTCRALCDRTHPCAVGSCSFFVGQPAGLCY